MAPERTLEEGYLLLRWKSLQMDQIMLQTGRYRHYKGAHYEVLGVARHSETEEELVVYKALYGERGLWVRPLAMFCEKVSVEGRETPRFAWVGGELPS